MQNKVFLFFLNFLFAGLLNAQNVGIGTLTPLDPLHVNGFTRSNGLRVTNDNYIELGFGIANKQQDNGKIAMNAFGEANTLSIVGGGIAADGSDRKIKLWANGGTSILGNVGIWATPGLSSLTLASSNGSNLLLQHTAANNAGVQTTINFGGSNYTTASVRAIGESSTAARLGLFTGYSFQGGISNLQERITISNTGNVGIGNTAPQQALDINGTIRFSGSTPAAFTLRLSGNMMFDNSYFIDSGASCSRVRIDHPYANNNPNAIILITPVSNAVPAGVSYRVADGYWYMQYHQSAYINGSRFTSYQNCDVNECDNRRLWPLIESEIFTKGASAWNILIVSK